MIVSSLLSSLIHSGEARCHAVWIPKASQKNKGGGKRNLERGECHRGKEKTGFSQSNRNVTPVRAVVASCHYDNQNSHHWRSLS